MEDRENLFNTLIALTDAMQEEKSNYKKMLAVQKIADYLELIQKNGYQAGYKEGHNDGYIKGLQQNIENMK